MQTQKHTSPAPHKIRYFGCSINTESVIASCKLPTDFYCDNGVEFIIREKYRTPELEAAIESLEKAIAEAERWRQSGSVPCTVREKEDKARQQIRQAEQAITEKWFNS